MNINYTNNLIVIFFIFLLFSCNALEKININKSDQNYEHEISANYELNQIIDYQNITYYENNVIDFYNKNSFNFEKNFFKKNKHLLNNYSKFNEDRLNLKSYILDNKIYSVNNNSELIITDINNYKLLNKIKLDLSDLKDVLYPTSVSLYYNSLIIGFNSGHIIKINNEGKIIWSYFYNQILSTPIKIINENIFALYGNTIKIIAISDGYEIYSEYFEGNKIFQAKGGKITNYLNLLFFILPNNNLGSFDSILNKKHNSIFENLDIISSINNSNDKLHIYKNYLIYLDEGEYLQSIDLVTDKRILNKIKISSNDSNVFFNNSIIVKNNNKLISYNVINGKIFWILDLDSKIGKKTKILDIYVHNKNLNIIFDNGKILILIREV